uniref:Uncharacterized protein n=1 Tax=Anguilla anguilla TaxID=7936 RepID=A0A0E9S6L2_ANGAN
MTLPEWPEISHLPQTTICRAAASIIITERCGSI